MIKRREFVLYVRIIALIAMTMINVLFVLMNLRILMEFALILSVRMALTKIALADSVWTVINHVKLAREPSKMNASNATIPISSNNPQQHASTVMRYKVW